MEQLKKYLYLFHRKRGIQDMCGKEELKKYLYPSKYEDGIWADLNSHFKNLWLRDSSEVENKYKEFLQKLEEREILQQFAPQKEKKPLSIVFVLHSQFFQAQPIYYYASLDEETKLKALLYHYIYLLVERDRIEGLNTLKISRTVFNNPEKRPIIAFITGKQYGDGDKVVNEDDKNGLCFLAFSNLEKKCKNLTKEISRFKKELQKAELQIDKKIEEFQTKFCEIFNKSNRAPTLQKLMDQLFKESSDNSDLKNLLNEIKNYGYEILKKIKSKVDKLSNDPQINLEKDLDEYKKAISFDKLEEQEMLFPKPDLKKGFLFSYLIFTLFGLSSYHILSLIERGEPATALIVSTEKPLSKEELKELQELITRFSSLLMKYESEAILERQNRRAGGVAILVESYAHNIGAHALPGVKKIFDEWPPPKEDKQIFLSYLQGKSAFWNAASRGGILFGGEIVSLWDVIEDFSKNKLLCSSIGASEGWKGVEIKICLGEGWDEEQVKSKEAWEEELRKSEIYLPEGVVGQQALYTIWENILRNVKHLAKPPKNGNKHIPFRIKIDKEGEFYKLSCWIEWKQANERYNECPKQFEDEIIESRLRNWKGIIDEKNHRINMGGLSQNILCAGMLLGYDFIQIERKYKPFEEEGEKKEELITFSRKEGEGYTAVVWEFKIWQGQNMISWKDYKKKKDLGPLGRFKIVTYEDDNERDELLEQSMIVRCVKREGNEDFGQLYKKWVQKFILKKDDEMIAIRGHNWESMRSFSLKKWSEETNPSQSNLKRYRFYHGENHEASPNVIAIDIKGSHYMKRFQGNEVLGRDDLLAELVEIVATKIDIFDDRLYNAYEKLDEKQKELLQALGVNCKPEDEFEKTKLSQDDVEKKHFLVIHLSRIESLTSKSDAQAIREFWSHDDYKAFLSKYNFVVVTTGRGRRWLDDFKRSNIADRNDKEIARKLRYTPVENLERCFEKANELEPSSPAIGAKYALVKTIIGS